MDMSLGELQELVTYKGRPGVLWFMGSQRVGHDWATELKCALPALFAIFMDYLFPSFPFLCICILKALMSFL